MRSSLLLAMLLLPCVWRAAQAQAHDHTDTLRLCGRAFLRAVVYTCGGSRWRRLTKEEEALPNGSRNPNFLKTTDVPVIERHWRDQNQALMLVCCQLGCRRSDLSMVC